MRTTRKQQLLKIFNKLYPNPRSELNFRNEYELVVSVVLSAQCTDKKVNEVTPYLFERYPSFPALSKARLSSLEAIVRPINYYKTKSKNLRAMAEHVCAIHSGRLPTSMEELMALPGVGRKTASVILCEQQITPALPVDTHVLRVSNRLALACGVKPEQIEDQLRAEFEPTVWHDLHHWLIFHGRRVCKARNPSCSICQLADFCPSKGIPA